MGKMTETKTFIPASAEKLSASQVME